MKKGKVKKANSYSGKLFFLLIIHKMHLHQDLHDLTQ